MIVSLSYVMISFNELLIEIFSSTFVEAKTESRLNSIVLCVASERAPRSTSRLKKQTI